MAKEHIDHCEACNDKGYIVTVVYNSIHVPDGTKQIQRCDTCMRFPTDELAEQAAKADGVVIKETESKPLYVLKIHRGKITRSNFEQLGAMIEEGYFSGFDIPAGMNWTLEIGEYEEDVDIEDDLHDTFHTLDEENKED